MNLYNNKIIFLWLLTLLAVLPAMQAQLIISPLVIDQTLSLGEVINVTINLTNTHNFTIYNITLLDNPFATFIQADILNPNQSISVPLKINASALTTTTLPLTFKFLFTQTIIEQPKTVNVNILSTSFSPSSLTINMLDIITWANTDNVIHTVTNVDGNNQPNQQIYPNTTFSFTFNEVKTYTLVDNSIGFSMSVIVQNNTKTIFVNNPQLNKQITLNLNAQLPATQLEIELLNVNFNMTYNGKKEGILKIKNLGSKEAVNVRFSASKWIAFSKTGFNLNGNDETFTIFTIKPVILTNGETGITHNITITTECTNCETKQNSIGVFINPANITDVGLGNLTVEQLIQKIRELQEFLALANFILKENQTIYLQSPIQINLSASDALNLTFRLSRVETKQDEIAERLNPVSFAFAEQVRIMNNTLSRLIGLEIDSQQREIRSRVLWTFALIIFLLGLVIGGYFLFKGLIKKKQAQL